MNVVLDTNVLISALVFGGKPRTVFESVIDGAAIGITSEKLLAELLGVLKVKFGYDPNHLRRVSELVRCNFELVVPSVIPDRIKDDPFDNNILAAALAGKVNFIISGDQHLLKLGRFGQVQILSPGEFLKGL